MAAPLVRLSGVGKTFDTGVTAVSGLDLDVHEGEFLSILGPSGCGKTTVLRMIAGLETPTKGVIETGARTAGEGGLSFVFQEPTLMPWASAADASTAGDARSGRAAVGSCGPGAAAPGRLMNAEVMRVAATVTARATATRPVSRRVAGIEAGRWMTDIGLLL